MNRQLYRAAVTVVAAVLLGGVGAGVAHAGNINPNDDGSQYAYGENIGWINLNPAQGPGVTVTDTALSGSAWGENIGWITLDPTDGGVVNDGTGKLSGYAWGENVGWINFAPTGGGVSIDTCGDFNGQAWGENVGWISFRSSGAVPYKVTSAWVSPVDTVAPDTTVSGPGIDLSGWNNIDANLTLSTTDCGTGTNSVYYSLDGGPVFITGGTSATVDITAEGVHSLTYYAMDNAGNIEATQSASIMIDKTPPVVDLSSPGDGASYTLHSGATASFSATDAVSGIASVISTAPEGSDITNAAGPQSFTVSATDKAGNTTSVTHTYTVVFPGNIDSGGSGNQYAWGENVGWINFKPAYGPGVTVTDTAVTGQAWGENIGWITFDPTDGGVVNDGTGKLSGYAWSENTGWINFAPTGGGVTIDACGDFNGQAWGENVGWINFRSDGPVPFKVTSAWVSPVDGVAPDTTVSGPGIDLSGWNSTDANLTIAATDCGTGVKEVHYTLDGGAEVVTTDTSAMVDITADGTHTLSYYAVDSAGNIEAAQSASIMIDKTPPTVDVTTPVQGATYTINSGVAASFSADDALSGIAGVTSTLPNGADLTTTAGQHDFLVSATDNAGNTTTVLISYTVVYPGNIDPSGSGAHYAWGENVGWINLEPSYGPGVTVTDTAVTGQAWGENIGWITFDPANGGGVVNDGAGNLSGYAWGENTGWINFAPTGGGVTIDPATGVFSGDAWGENVGWINFAPSGAAVKTAWRGNTEPADLAVSDLTVSPNPAAVGQMVTVTATITNTGVAPAQNFQVDLYKNLASAPAGGQTGDITCQVSSLAAGADTTCSGQLSYDAVMTAVVWAQADTLNAVTEATKTNNISHTGLAVKLPDLRITALTVPASAVTVGQAVDVSAVVKNVSAVDVVGTFTVDLYQNLSSTPGVNQGGDANCTFSGLDSQATVTCTGTVTYAATGTYNAWAQADTQDTVTEAYETNNVAGPAAVTVTTPYTLTLATSGNGTGTVTGAGSYNAGASVTVSASADPGSSFGGWSGPNGSECATGTVVMTSDKSCTATFTVTSPADLVVSGITVSPSPAAVGQVVTLTATVSNNGASTATNFAVDLYKNRSTRPAVGQAGDVTCPISSLAVGASTTCSGQVSYATTGTKIVWAQADTQNTVPESSETNNTYHVGVSVRLPDLRVISLTVPTGATAGQPVTLTAKVEDVSPVDVTGTFEVDVYQNLAGAPGLNQAGDITCTVTGLAAYATTICTGTVIYPTVGSYKVWAQADTLNAINETYETNNLKGPVSLTVK